MATSNHPTLYKRLSGVYSIAAVVDNLIDRVMDDPRLNANPRVDEAHHRVSRAGFKYLATKLVYWVTDGPQQCSGRLMRGSHQHLLITAVEWDAFLDDLQHRLDKFGVPPAEQSVCSLTCRDYLSARARYTFSAVIGRSLMRTPTASSTALAMAGATGPTGFSPIPFA
jgi:hemoglobin